MWINRYILYTILLLAVLIFCMVFSVMILKCWFLASLAFVGCGVALGVLYYLYDCLALCRRRRERLKRNVVYQIADRKLKSDELFMVYCHMTESERW